MLLWIRAFRFFRFGIRREINRARQTIEFFFDIRNNAVRDCSPKFLNSFSRCPYFHAALKRFTCLKTEGGAFWIYRGVLASSAFLLSLCSHSHTPGKILERIYEFSVFEDWYVQFWLGTQRGRTDFYSPARFDSGVN